MLNKIKLIKLHFPMANYSIYFTSDGDFYLKRPFSNSGLKSTTTDLGDGTVIHVWVPETTTPSKPNLLLLHGLGPNAIWDWLSFISPLLSTFNLYIPDLVFFGDSHTTRSDRSEYFQAQSVMSAMARLGVAKVHVAGMSYGGYVGYSIAAQFPEAVERVVLCCSGVWIEPSDYDSEMFRLFLKPFGYGHEMFNVKSVEETVAILLAETPEKVEMLARNSFYKPAKHWPNFFRHNHLDTLNAKYVQQRKECIEALLKDRKLCDLPKITQPIMIIWGENDMIFPLELAHRLKSQLGENSELVILKNAGHAITMERARDLYEHLISFFVNHATTPTLAANKKAQSRGCGCFF